MNRSLHPLIVLALAAAVACVSAYAFLYMHGPATGRVPTPTIALVATAGAPPPRSVPPPGAAISYPPGAETPAAMVSYRDAVARAAPSVVTVHSAHMLKGRLPLSPAVVVKGLGSGVIIDRDGYIVTNYHVVEDDIAVRLGAPRTPARRAVALAGSVTSQGNAWRSVTASQGVLWWLSRNIDESATVR